MTTKFKKQTLEMLQTADPESAKVRAEIRNTLEKGLLIERQHSDWMGLNGAFQEELDRGKLVKFISKRNEGD